MAASETMQTICSLRDRGKTWYGGGFGAWLSRLIEEDDDARFFSSVGERLELESQDLSETAGAFRDSGDLKSDIVKQNNQEIDLRVHKWTILKRYRQEVEASTSCLRQNV